MDHGDGPIRNHIVGSPVDYVDVTTDLSRLFRMVTVEEHRGNAILETVGRAIEEAADSVRALVLDFDNVTFINSSGIACFIRLCKGLKEKGIRTIIYRPGANLGDIFREMTLDKMFEFVETPRDLKAV